MFYFYSSLNLTIASVTLCASLDYAGIVKKFLELSHFPPISFLWEFFRVYLSIVIIMKIVSCRYNSSIFPYIYLIYLMNFIIHYNIQNGLYPYTSSILPFRDFSRPLSYYGNFTGYQQKKLNLGLLLNNQLNLSFQLHDLNKKKTQNRQLLNFQAQKPWNNIAQPPYMGP